VGPDKKASSSHDPCRKKKKRWGKTTTDVAENTRRERRVTKEKNKWWEGDAKNQVLYGRRRINGVGKRKKDPRLDGRSEGWRGSRR